MKKTEKFSSPEPLSFKNIFESNFRLPRRVCIVAPGPNGKEYYSKIPNDCSVITVSKAVLIPELRGRIDIWMMCHGDQDWFKEAKVTFNGMYVFSYDGLVQAQALLTGKTDCYYFKPPEEYLEENILWSVEGCIRYGGTVSGCALQFAYNFGAKEILLCGIDMSGEQYWDNTLTIHPRQRYHHGEIWTAARNMNPLIKWMIEEKGIKIFTLSPTKLNVPNYNFE